ncbi:hypothetical protein [Nostoc sp.]
MPKRQKKKTNSSPSQEVVAPTQPAIVRVVKQETTATYTNNAALSKSELTTAPKENQNTVTELHVNNNQSQSKEEESSNSTSVPTPDAGLQKINAVIGSSNFPSTVSTATVNVEELTRPDSSKVLELAQSELQNKQPQLEKRIPPYKKLETVTNCSGQTFAVGDEIQVSTSNFGVQQAVIKFLSSAPDGSIWASYYPLTKEHQQQWKWGYCRIEYLQKLSSNPSSD